MFKATYLNYALMFESNSIGPPQYTKMGLKSLFSFLFEVFPPIFNLNSFIHFEVNGSIVTSASETQILASWVQDNVSSVLQD